MKNIVFCFTLTCTLILLSSKIVLAKRVLPRAQTTKTTVVTKTKGVSTSVRFRSDRQAVVINFSNLAVAKKVDYVLSYYTRGTTQGASGTINIVSNDAVSRELIFGTCSHGVCRYDSGISNARLVITSTLSSGIKVIKSYRLKI